MAPQIARLTSEHVPEAAALVSARYRRLCLDIPELPPRYGEVDVVQPMLLNLVGAAPGFVATKGGRLVGVLAGVTIPSFKGRRTVYCPEWAHASEQGARGIDERLYAAAARAWADDGCSCHLISQLAGDPTALDTWFFQGFGCLSIDALRDLGLPSVRQAAANVRRATPTDLAALLTLSRGLSDHLASSPVFLASHPEPEEVLGSQLTDERFAVWLVEEEGRPVAFMRIGPASHNACGIIVDEGTASITGAYAEPRARRKGIAATLLRACVAWAKEQGYVRCAVDCESANVEGRRFWLRHFAPICYGLMRCMDEAALTG